jgi:pyruvate/2-oxoglutarate dehydrogenase complex dihydrolipoamide dehydrogenase (E3) component
VRSTIERTDDTDSAADQLRSSGVHVRIGDARFISPDAIELSEREGPTRLITSAHFLLATGSSPARPDIPGLAEIGYITNHEVYDLIEPPESLIVITGDAAGVELAQAFSRLDSRVTLLATGPRILPHDDFEAADTLAEALRAEGIDIRVNAEVLSGRAEDGRKVLRIREGESESEIAAHEILVATGRTPNIEGLQLEAARVESTPDGVKVNPRLHTTGPRVWACGDVVGRYPLSQMAEFESKLVVHNILFPINQKADPALKLAPWVTFTDPEVARVGLTEDAAQRQGVQYQVFRQSFTESGTAGFVKVLAAGWQGRILGAHIVGQRAGELIQEWVTAITQGQTMRQVAGTIHLNPTLSMANQNAATRWSEAQADRPLVKRSVEAYTRSIRPNLPRIALGLLGLGIVAGGALIAHSLSRRENHE